MDDILKVSIFMKDVKDFNKMDQVYREFFKLGYEPARVTVQARSPIEGVKIEIEVIAIVPEPSWFTKIKINSLHMPYSTIKVVFSESNSICAEVDAFLLH